MGSYYVAVRPVGSLARLALWSGAVWGVVVAAFLLVGCGGNSYPGACQGVHRGDWALHLPTNLVGQIRRVDIDEANIRFPNDAVFTVRCRDLAKVSP